MLTEDIYTTMLDNDETWFVLPNGSAAIIYDCALQDC
jgi:hypothetical protein